jgi:hypothetical protein
MALVKDWPGPFRDLVVARFAWTKHHLIATVRADGSPRISGTEVYFWEDNWWIGSMPGSRKSADLRRDPRMAVHSAPQPAEEGMSLGDAKLSALAVDLSGTDDFNRFVQHLTDAGSPPPPGPFDLFRLDVTEAAVTRVEGSDLVIDHWSPTDGYRQVKRR